MLQVQLGAVEAEVRQLLSEEAVTLEDLKGVECSITAMRLRITHLIFVSVDEGKRSRSRHDVHLTWL